MKLSFGWKLGIVIVLLSVGLTSTGVYIYYSMTYRIMMNQMGKNLKDVGRLGIFLFGQEGRDAIRRLKLAAEQQQQISAAELNTIPVGGTRNSLPTEVISRLEASDDFLLIRKKLRMISAASYPEFKIITENLDLIQDDYQLVAPLELMRNGIIATYLIVDTQLSPDREIVQFLVSAGNAPAPDGWPGNPVGNLYRPNYPVKNLFNGQATFLEEIVTNRFYTGLLTNLPVVDEQGKTLAVLGLDFVTGKELEKLDRLAVICVSLIGASFMLSILVSYLAARALNRPLVALHRTALEVSRQNYDAEVTITSSDEFGVLGEAFRQMLASIRNSFKSLEMKNQQLSSVISDMHDGIGSILTNISMTSRDNAQTDPQDQLVPINRLARQGLSEVRFLMGALDYEECDFSVIGEEMEMLAIDILKPSGVVFALDLPNSLPLHRISFKVFLDLQRVFREIFTNIVKHSDADYCAVGIDFAKHVYHIRVKDNGSKFGHKSASGRGLISITNRVNRIGGTLEHRFADGFLIEIMLPYEGL